MKNKKFELVLFSELASVQLFPVLPYIASFTRASFKSLKMHTGDNISGITFRIYLSMDGHI